MYLLLQIECCLDHVPVTLGSCAFYKYAVTYRYLRIFCFLIAPRKIVTTFFLSSFARCSIFARQLSADILLVSHPRNFQSHTERLWFGLAVMASWCFLCIPVMLVDDLHISSLQITVTHEEISHCSSVLCSLLLLGVDWKKNS